MKPRSLFVWLVLAAVWSWAGDNKPVFSPPPASHAKTYPAHESHDDEKVSIAVDPFDSPEKAKVFKTSYQDKGFLPIRLIVSNDSDSPLNLDDLKILFITVRRDKIEPATRDDIYRRLFHLKRNPSDQRNPLPIPIPRSKDPVSKEARAAMAELDEAEFVPRDVAPRELRSGFLFFDVTDIQTPEAGAHIQISGLKANKKELFYFDIPLEKYLSYQPGK